MRIEELLNHFAETNREYFPRLGEIDGKFSSHVLGDILAGDNHKTPLQNLDEVIKTKQGTGTLSEGHSWYNTYPFGTPTHKPPFPRFLAVCNGGRRLKTVLDRVKLQSERMAAHYGGQENVEKTVIVLTDKWNHSLFKMYEEDFLNHALQDGIWYIFLFVTDYGCTQIPFLPNDRRIFHRYQGQRLDEKPQSFNQGNRRIFMTRWDMRST